MRESIWGYAVIVLGILAIGIIWFFANATRTDQHNNNLLKETVEASMYDAIDLSAYRKDGTIRIEEEKFVESFIFRFAENADLSNTYKIEIFDINEEPPKVSLRVSTKKDTNATGEIVEFDIVNNIDAILETNYFDLTSVCTMQKPCYIGESYISLKEQDSGKGTSNWTISAQDFNLPESIKNYEGYKLVTEMSDVYWDEYNTQNATWEDIVKRVENGCIWYKGFTDSKGRFTSFYDDNGECKVSTTITEEAARATASKLARITSTNLTLDKANNLIKIETKYESNIEKPDLLNYFSIKWKYYYVKE